MTLFENPSSSRFVRATGALYLIIAIAGGFSIAFVPSQLYVPGDLAGSAKALLAARPMFLAGIAGDIVMMSAELFVTAMLYQIFRATNPTLSLVAALARLTMVTTMAVMLMFHAGMTAFASPDLLSTFTEEQRMQLAGIMLYMHDSGVWVWQIFFTIHLWVLGALILKSGLFPRVFGFGIIVGGAGYLADSAFAFAFPDFAALGMLRVGLLSIVTVSELGFAFWLLFAGTRNSLQPSAA